MTAEWRNFGHDGNGKGGQSSLNRTGGENNQFLEGMGLGVMIQGANKKTYYFNESAKDQAIRSAKRIISDMCLDLGLKKNVEVKALEFFHLAEHKEVLRGKRINAKVAACIFQACRSCNCSKPLKKILEITNTTKKELSRCLKCLTPIVP
jgi:transcription initiation factor TFIIB